MQTPPSRPLPPPEDPALFKVNLNAYRAIYPHEFQRPCLAIRTLPQYVVIIGSSVGITHDQEMADATLDLVPDGWYQEMPYWSAAVAFYLKYYRDGEIRVRFRGNCNLIGLPPHTPQPIPLTEPPVYEYVSSTTSTPQPSTTGPSGVAQTLAEQIIPVRRGKAAARKATQTPAPSTPTPAQKTRPFLLDTTPSPEGPIGGMSAFTLVPTMRDLGGAHLRRRRSPSLEVMNSPRPVKRPTPPLIDLTLIASASESENVQAVDTPQLLNAVEPLDNANNSDTGHASDALTVITISDASEDQAEAGLVSGAITVITISDDDEDSQAIDKPSSIPSPPAADEKARFGRSATAPPKLEYGPIKGTDKTVTKTGVAVERFDPFVTRQANPSSSKPRAVKDFVIDPVACPSSPVEGGPSLSWLGSPRPTSSPDYGHFDFDTEGLEIIDELLYNLAHPSN